jgi:glucuronate isomerase
MAIDNPADYNAYLAKLEEAANISINSYDALMQALQIRHDYFESLGCCVSDHGMETFYAEAYSDAEIRAIFDKVRAGREACETEILKFRSAMLHDFAVMDAKSGWVQQFHVGANRNNNPRMFAKLGADTGFDSIHDSAVAGAMNCFFGRLDLEGALTKTIVYNLNPRDNELMVTNAYNFNDGTVPGKMQYGAAWWFLDQKTGMENQLNALSALGLLSRFVGMLTDSRSFLSYPRHEYFRRILCNLLGSEIEAGEIPVSELPFVEQMVENISYYNAKNYFGF